LRSRDWEFDAGKLAEKRLWCEVLEIAVEDEPGTGLALEHLADELVGVDFVGSWSCQSPIVVSIICDCVFKSREKLPCGVVIFASRCSVKVIDPKIESGVLSEFLGEVASEGCRICTGGHSDAVNNAILDMVLEEMSHKVALVFMLDLAGAATALKTGTGRNIVNDVDVDVVVIIRLFLRHVVDLIRPFLDANAISIFRYKGNG
jgi:hypothetical protein